MTQKETIILGYINYKKGNENIPIPIILCEPRKDFPEGMRFYCDFCKKYHLHGEGEGHRVSHCHTEKSPLERSGYIITLDPNYCKYSK